MNQFSEGGRARLRAAITHAITSGDFSGMQRTLIILKPDCVQRRLAGTILARFEAKGLKIVGLKLI
ncbi:MAG: nucleoside-diphosphate kinase, partial [Isosphaeraceae bacterium]